MKITALTAASAKGTRPYQEDRFLIHTTPFGTLLGVFDGHGGEEAAAFAHENFVNLCNNQTELAQNEGQLYQKLLSNALRDLAIMLENYEDGTTASLAFLPNDPEGMPVRNKYIFTAVIGDSPIIIRSGENIWRSPEHNVRSNPAEREAAENRGGYVHSGYLFSSTSGHGQGLQMSRALGDKFLRGIISTEAETAAVQVQEDGYIIVATDGVFDPGHAQGATDDFFKNLHDTANAQSLVDYAVNELKTGDNATAILARF